MSFVCVSVNVITLEEALNTLKGKEIGKAEEQKVGEVGYSVRVRHLCRMDRV